MPIHGRQGKRHASKRATMRHGVSGRKLAEADSQRGLSIPLQNFPSGADSVRLVDMGPDELEAYFEQLLALVLCDGEVQ